MDARQALDTLEYYVATSGQVLKGTYEADTVEEVTPEMMNDVERTIQPAMEAIIFLRKDLAARVIERTKLLNGLQAFLDPEDLGYTVNESTQNRVREVLGKPLVGIK